jgi:hypothetical protein
VRPNQSKLKAPGGGEEMRYSDGEVIRVIIRAQEMFPCKGLGRENWEDEAVAIAVAQCQKQLDYIKEQLPCFDFNNGQLVRCNDWVLKWTELPISMN